MRHKLLARKIANGLKGKGAHQAFVTQRLVRQPNSWAKTWVRSGFVWVRFFRLLLILKDLVASFR